MNTDRRATLPHKTLGIVTIINSLTQRIGDALVALCSPRLHKKEHPTSQALSILLHKHTL